MDVNLADHRKAYVCTHVLSGERPVLHVTRPEGDWCALCGDEHPDSPDAYRVVGLGHVLAQDPTISEVADLQSGEQAERGSVEQAWTRSRIAPQ